MKIVCDNTTCKIVDRPSKQVNDLLWGECSYEVPGAEHIRYASGKANRRRYRDWDGFIRLYHRSRRTFGAGLLRRISKQLDRAGVEYEVEYVRPDVERVEIPWIDNDEIEDREYQDDTVDTAIEQERCMLRVATGGGKTLIAAKLVHRLGRYTVFLVHTKDLLYQAKTMMEEVLDTEVGQIGDGIVDPKTVTIVTTQTASRALGIAYESNDEDDKWKDEDTAPDERVVATLKRAGLVFMDECHRVAAPTATGVLEAMEVADYRIGLSASPWRDDGADIALEAAFGHVAVSISATELWEQGYLVRPVIRMLEVPPMMLPSDLRYDQLYKQYVVENEKRNKIGIDAAINMMERGRLVLILVRYIRHGKMIEEAMRERGWPVPFLSGSDSSQVRKEALDLMRDEKLRGIIATTIADEGLDIKPLSGLVLLGGGKSSVRALQRVGRVLRPFGGKESAEVVDFDDQAKWLHDHSRERQRIYETEPGWLVTDI